MQHATGPKVDLHHTVPSVRKLHSVVKVPPPSAFESCIINFVDYFWHNICYMIGFAICTNILLLTHYAILSDVAHACSAVD